MNGTKFFIGAVVAAMALGAAAEVDRQTLYGEASLVGGYSTRDKGITESGNFLKNAAGLEYAGRASGEGSESLTWDIQARLSYDSREDGMGRFALELDDAWGEYSLDGERNIRFGHFAPCYGLEPSVDTHSTIFQTLQETDIGFKSDWGVGFRGFLESVDLAAALQAGSGMGLAHEDNSFLATTRLAGGYGEDFDCGISALFGNVLRSEPSRLISAPRYEDGSQRMARIGADTQVTDGPWLIRAEGTFGRNSNDTVGGCLAELNYTIPQLSDVTLTTQGQIWSENMKYSDKNHVLAGLGASLKVLPEWTLRGAVLREERPDETGDDTRVVLQLYYQAKQDIVSVP